MGDNPILITGMPRSGTTWVGKILATIPGMRYIHEPFNINASNCACGVEIPYWFYYVTPDNASRVHSHIDHLLGPQLSWWNISNMSAGLIANRRIRILIDFIRNIFARRSLLKAPLALVSSEWLANTYAMDVIVLVRHPAAIVSSYKRLGWTHPFDHFLKQTELMDDYLQDFIGQILSQIEGEGDIVDQVALLWLILHKIILQFKERNKNWFFLRYEDIARQPEGVFRDIIDRLELSPSRRTLKLIREYSDESNPVFTDDPYSVKRSSRDLICLWKNQLSGSEIKRTRTIVEEISCEFYSDLDW